ncbi:unnamed protein product [Amoebophrya sp. A120]|nr:unnamed protein product [Amoebophrya sp. A120]|eukprot:GSA120T00008206001.1
MRQHHRNRRAHAASNKSKAAGALLSLAAAVVLGSHNYNCGVHGLKMLAALIPPPMQGTAAIFSGSSTSSSAQLLQPAASTDAAGGGVAARPTLQQLQQSADKSKVTTWWDLPPHLQCIFGADMKPLAGCRGEKATKEKPDARKDADAVFAARNAQMMNILEPPERKAMPMIQRAMEDQRKKSAAIAKEFQAKIRKHNNEVAKQQDPNYDATAGAGADEDDGFQIVEALPQMDPKVKRELEELMWDALAADYHSRGQGCNLVGATLEKTKENCKKALNYERQMEVKRQQEQVLLMHQQQQALQAAAAQQQAQACAAFAAQQAQAVMVQQQVMMAAAMGGAAAAQQQHQAGQQQFQVQMMTATPMVGVPYPGAGVVVPQAPPAAAAAPANIFSLIPGACAPKCPPPAHAPGGVDGGKKGKAKPKAK